MLSLVLLYALDLECRAVRIPESTHNQESGYTAIEVGLDGKVYIGTAFYGGSSHLVSYDPATGKMADLVSTHELFREAGTGINAQGKIHTKLWIDSLGRVWGGTKQGHEIFDTRPEYGEDPAGYPGGHLFCYDPRTQQAEDRGILKKQEGLLGIALDKTRNMVYLVTDPKRHFLVYDIAKRTCRDLGVVGPANPRYVALCEGGVLYCPGEPGVIVRYDPAKDCLEDLPLRQEGTWKYVHPYAMAPSADGKKFYGVAIGHDRLMEYEPKGGELIVRSPCRTIDDGWTAGDQHTMCLGTDGRIYWTCHASNGKESGLFLLRYDPKAAKLQNLGKVVPEDRGFTVQHIQGSAFAKDGTLYVLHISPFYLLVFDRLAGQ